MKEREKKQNQKGAQSRTSCLYIPSRDLLQPTVWTFNSTETPSPSLRLCKFPRIFSKQWPCRIKKRSKPSWESPALPSLSPCASSRSTLRLSFFCSSSRILFISSDLVLFLFFSDGLRLSGLLHCRDWPTFRLWIDFVVVVLIDRWLGFSYCYCVRWLIGFIWESGEKCGEIWRLMVDSVTTVMCSQMFLLILRQWL